MSDTSQGVGWWVASDGRWYPPEQHPVQQMPPPPFPPPYWPGHSGPPPRWQPRQTNGLAIASMVLGILWIYWVGSVLALVFGYVALRQIRARDESGHSMAIAGIVLGWAGVAIGVIIAVVFVTVGGFSQRFRSTAQPRTRRCRSVNHSPPHFIFGQRAWLVRFGDAGPGTPSGNDPVAAPGEPRSSTGTRRH